MAAGSDPGEAAVWTAPREEPLPGLHAGSCSRGTEREREAQRPSGGLPSLAFPHAAAAAAAAFQRKGYEGVTALLSPSPASPPLDIAQGAGERNSFHPPFHRPLPRGKTKKRTHHGFPETHGACQRHAEKPQLVGDRRALLGFRDHLRIYQPPPPEERQGKRQWGLVGSAGVPATLEFHYQSVYNARTANLRARGSEGRTPGEGKVGAGV